MDTSGAKLEQLNLFAVLAAAQKDAQLQLYHDGPLEFALIEQWINVKIIAVKLDARLCLAAKENAAPNSSKKVCL